MHGVHTGGTVFPSSPASYGYVNGSSARYFSTQSTISIIPAAGNYRPVYTFTATEHSPPFRPQSPPTALRFSQDLSFVNGYSAHPSSPQSQMQYYYAQELSWRHCFLRSNTSYLRVSGFSWWAKHSTLCLFENEPIGSFRDVVFCGWSSVSDGPGRGRDAIIAMEKNFRLHR